MPEKESTFTPTTHEDGRGLRVVIAVPAKRCVVCKFPMIHASYIKDGFDVIGKVCVVKTDLDKVGFKIFGGIFDIGNLCTECRTLELAKFKCALCNKERPASQEHSRYGDPADILCTVCYGTVPAKVWEAKIDSLERSHRYDFT